MQQPNNLRNVPLGPSGFQHVQVHVQAHPQDRQRTIFSEFTSSWCVHAHEHLRWRSMVDGGGGVQFSSRAHCGLVDVTLWATPIFSTTTENVYAWMIASWMRQQKFLENISNWISGLRTIYETEDCQAIAWFRCKTTLFVVLSVLQSQSGYHFKIFAWTWS